MLGLLGFAALACCCRRDRRREHCHKKRCCRPCMPCRCLPCYGNVRIKGCGCFHVSNEQKGHGCRGEKEAWCEEEREEHEEKQCGLRSRHESGRGHSNCHDNEEHEKKCGCSHVDGHGHEWEKECGCSE